MSDRLMLIEDDYVNIVTIPTKGDYLFMCYGTFGGATVSLYVLGPDGTNYIQIPDSGLTSNGMLIASLGAGMVVFADVSGGSSSGLYASLDKVG